MTADVPDIEIVRAERHSRASVRWRWPDALVLAVVLIAALTVQWRQMESTPSFDELWHLMLSTGRGTPIGFFPPDAVRDASVRLTSFVDAPPISRVWTSLAGVPHPPFYFLLLRLWRDIAGEGDVSAHALSIACSMLAISFTFAAGRLAMDRWTAALAALALGCSQTQVFLAQEMRPYPLATALAAAALWLMTRIEVVGATRRAAIALASLTLPLLLTNYFAAGVCVAIAIVGSLRLGRLRGTFFLTLGVAAAVYAAVWLPFAIEQERDAGPAKVFLQTAHVDLNRELGLLACAPFRLIADRDYRFERTPLLTGVLFVLPWLLVRRLRSLLPWMTMLWGAIGIVVLIDLIGGRQHLSVVRYFTIASPAVMLLFVGSAWAVDRRLAYLAGITLAATGGIYLVSGSTVSGWCPTFGDSIAIVERDAQPGDAIVLYAGVAPSFYPDMLALTVVHSQELLPRRLIILSAPIAPAELAKLPTRVWFLSGHLDRPLAELLPGGRVVSTRVADVEVTVTLLEFPEVPPP